VSAEPERCLTVGEVAARWRCRPATVRELVRSGKLPAIQIGGRVRIAPEAVREVEQGTLAVRPARPRRRKERVPAEVARALGLDE
jgi:excisionase family DNA binding protein